MPIMSWLRSHAGIAYYSFRFLIHYFIIYLIRIIISHGFHKILTGLPPATSLARGPGLRQYSTARAYLEYGPEAGFSRQIS